MPAVFKRSTGFHGKIEIPDLGAVIGETASWSLARRGSDENSRDPESEFYDFRADLKFINATLFDDPDYEKSITIQAGKGQSYRLEPVDGPGQRTVLTGRSLIMERVRTCRL